jgi:amidase
LRRLLLSRDLSPVEVVEAALTRIEEVNGTVNAIVTINERAMDDARALELRGRQTAGLLYGLPVGVKDVTPVAGLRTTYGSKLYADNVPKEDALVVRRSSRRAGTRSTRSSGGRVTRGTSSGAPVGRLGAARRRWRRG